MLQQMDQTKEVTVTFGAKELNKPQNPARDYVIGKEQWDVQAVKWPKPVYFNPNDRWAQ